MTLEERISILCNAPGIPCAYPEALKICGICNQVLGEFTDDISTDRLGNTVARINCRPGAPTLMLCAPVDQIGLMITGVEEHGFLRFIAQQADARSLQGQAVEIYGAAGVVVGVISCGPAWMDVIGKPPAASDASALFVDTGIEDVSGLVAVGDMGLVRQEPRMLTGGEMMGHGMDGRAGLAAIAGALSRVNTGGLGVGIVIAATMGRVLGMDGGVNVAFSESPSAIVSIEGVSAEKSAANGLTLLHSPHAADTLSPLLDAAAQKTGVALKHCAMPLPNAGAGVGPLLQGHTLRYATLQYPVKWRKNPLELISLSHIESLVELIAEFIYAYAGSKGGVTQ